MKKFLSLTCSAAMLMGLFACSSNTASNDASTTDEEAAEQVIDEASTKSVAFSKENDAVTFDTDQATDGMSFEMQNAVIEGLLSNNTDGEIIPAIAETWEASEDGMTWTFHLRDANWANGTPVTSDDFIFAWNRAVKDPSDEYAYLFGDQGVQVENGQEILDAVAAGDDVTDMDLGMTAVDDKTLEVRLSQNNSIFEWMTTFPTFFPINQAFFEEAGAEYGLTPETVLSNGPYILVSWEKDSKITMKKNETYWDAENVHIDELVFNIIKDANSAALAYESGDLDFATINGTLIDAYADNPDLYDYLEGYLWYVEYNTNNEYLSNQNLRMALSLAIDRTDLVENVLKDGSVAVDGFIPFGLSYDPATGKDYREINGYYFSDDPEKNLEDAKDYLEKAKKELGTDTIDLTFLYENSYPADQAAQFIQSNWAQLPGVTITMDGQEKANRLDLQRQRNFDLVLNRWGPDYADPTTYLTIKTGAQAGTGMNYSDWINEDYDKLLEEAGSGIDAEERYQKLLEAEKILMDEVPLCGVFQVSGLALKNPKLSGVESYVAGVPFRYKNLVLED